MADEKEGPPMGDASHVLDDVPPPTVERSTMPVPVAQRVVSPEGEVLRDAKPTDKPLAVIPGELVRKISSEQRMKDALVVAEPCPDCRFAHWPDESEFRWVQAFLLNYFGGIPTWMRPHVPGSDPHEYVICSGAPHGKEGPVHIMNHCEHFRAKRGVRSKKGLIARMFGRFTGRN